MHIISAKKMPLVTLTPLILLSIIGWAFAFPLIKIALEELSFINLTLLRFSITCSALLVLLCLQPHRFTALQKNDIIPIFILGFFGIIAYHLGLNYGEQYVSPGAASLIVATIPVFVAVMAVRFLEETMTVRKIVGIGLSLLGIVILTIWGQSNTTIAVDYIFGALAVLLAAIMGAIYTIAGKKMLSRYSAFSLTTYAMLLGSIGLLPTISASFVSQVSEISWQTWISVIFLGLFSTIVSYTLWYIALEAKGASELSVYIYAVPILSTIISYVLFGDAITPLFIIGGTLVIIGVAIVNRRQQVL